MNVAIITHNGYDKFLFSVPDEVQLKKGEKVLCQTKKGEAHGECVFDSFEVEGTALVAITAVMGAKLPLKPVIGLVQEWRFDKKSPIFGTEAYRIWLDRMSRTFCEVEVPY